MAVSSNVKNIKLGPCSVTYGGVDLGLTKGGVQVELTTAKHEVNVDQFGSAAVNEYITGRTGKVTVPLAETDLQKLLAVIPGANRSRDTGYTPAREKLEIPTAVGTSMVDIAQKLVLHPTGNANSNKADDVSVPLATPDGNLNFEFAVDKERVYSIIFTMYPDADGLLMVMGDDRVS